MFCGANGLYWRMQAVIYRKRSQLRRHSRRTSWPDNSQWKKQGRVLPDVTRQVALKNFVAPKGWYLGLEFKFEFGFPIQCNRIEAPNGSCGAYVIDLRGCEIESSERALAPV